MDPNVFRKGDAKSILAINKSWEDIIGKPDSFDEMARRILTLATAAEGRLLTKPDTLTRVKSAINDVLITPLTEDYGDSHLSPQNTTDEDVVYTDAYWEEFPDVPEGLNKALEDFLRMLDAIKNNQPLGAASTLMDVKELFNEAVIKPILGIEQDE